jgi:hypothetical protein
VKPFGAIGNKALALFALLGASAGAGSNAVPMPSLSSTYGGTSRFKPFVHVRTGEPHGRSGDKLRRRAMRGKVGKAVLR